MGRKFWWLLGEYTPGLCIFIPAGIQLAEGNLVAGFALTVAAALLILSGWRSMQAYRAGVWRGRIEIIGAAMRGKAGERIVLPPPDVDPNPWDTKWQAADERAGT